MKTAFRHLIQSHTSSSSSTGLQHIIKIRRLHMQAIPSCVKKLLRAEARSKHLLISWPGTEPHTHDVRYEQRVMLLDECIAATPTITGIEIPDQEDRWKVLYDVMRMHHQHILFGGLHRARIDGTWRGVTGQSLSSATAEAIAAALPHFVAEVYAREFSATERELDHNLKFITWVDTINTATTVEHHPSFILFLSPSFFPPPSWYVDGTRMALLFNAHRENPNAKTLQPALRARVELALSSYNVFEVLLVHDAAHGFLVPEGSRSNYLLITSEDEIRCSADSDILVGTTLQSVRRAAEGVGLTVHHQRINLADLSTAKSLVMLGTSPGALPVREVVLYHTAEEKAIFVEAVKALGHSLAMHSPQVEEEEECCGVVELSPTKAVLRLEVGNPVLRQIMKAYETAALNG